jgi:hypothetical protein
MLDGNLTSSFLFRSTNTERLVVYSSCCCSVAGNSSVVGRFYLTTVSSDRINGFLWLQRNLNRKRGIVSYNIEKVVC